MGFLWGNSDCGAIPKLGFGKASRAHSGQSSSFLQVKVSGHFLSFSSPSHFLFPGKGHQASKRQSSSPKSPEKALALWAHGSGPVAASCHRAESGERPQVTAPSQSHYLQREGVQRKRSQQRPTTFTCLFHLSEGHMSCGNLFALVLKHVF